jgi:hypothetical protein
MPAETAAMAMVAELENEAEAASRLDLALALAPALTLVQKAEALCRIVGDKATGRRAAASGLSLPCPRNGSPVRAVGAAVGAAAAAKIGGIAEDRVEAGATAAARALIEGKRKG